MASNEQNRSKALNIPQDASKDELREVLTKLVESGAISAEAVNGELESIREVTGQRLKATSAVEKQLDPEQVEAWLGELKTRFDALPQLHKGVKFADVEKSLRADPESMARLQALDEKGHKMNVFGEEKGEFIFASGWDNYKKVSEDHRNIVFDPEAQKYLADNYPGEKCNGNAVSIIAEIMGVKEDEARNYLADSKFHEQLRKAIEVNGWAWLKTDAATREAGDALYGGDGGFDRRDASVRYVDGSFRAALRVKKA